MTLDECTRQVQTAVQSKRSNVWIEHEVRGIRVNFRCQKCLAKMWFYMHHTLPVEDFESIADMILEFIGSSELDHQREKSCCNSLKT